VLRVYKQQRPDLEALQIGPSVKSCR